jgi:hypothetical protein
MNNFKYLSCIALLIASHSLVAMEAQLTRAEKLAKIKADAERRKAAATAATTNVMPPTTEILPQPPAQVPPPKPPRRSKPTTTTTSSSSASAEEAALRAAVENYTTQKAALAELAPQIAQLKQDTVAAFESNKRSIDGSLQTIADLRSTKLNGNYDDPKKLDQEIFQALNTKDLHFSTYQDLLKTTANQISNVEKRLTPIEEALTTASTLYAQHKEAFPSFDETRGQLDTCLTLKNRLSTILLEKQTELETLRADAQKAFQEFKTAYENKPKPTSAPSSSSSSSSSSASSSSSSSSSAASEATQEQRIQIANNYIDRMAQLLIDIANAKKSGDVAQKESLEESYQNAQRRLFKIAEEVLSDVTALSAEELEISAYFDNNKLPTTALNTKIRNKVKELQGQPSSSDISLKQQADAIIEKMIDAKAKRNKEQMDGMAYLYVKKSLVDELKKVVSQAQKASPQTATTRLISSYLQSNDNPSNVLDTLIETEAKKR